MAVECSVTACTSIVGYKSQKQIAAESTFKTNTFDGATAGGH